MLASDSALRITEIFYSLQGESSLAGKPTVFVRLTGCPLRCVYCDTEYAFQGGDQVLLADILQQVASYKAECVCVTGGEPLAQPECRSLLTLLCNAGYTVSLETGGAMDIGNIDARVKIILDLKTPDSGEMEKNLYDNVGHLKNSDEVKFVVAGERDYQWALQVIEKYGLASKVDNILVSPVHGAVALDDLAEWILRDHAPVRMQVQMHKLIWGEKPGH